METELKEKLMREAEENNISISDLIRKKLRSNSQLDKIERMLEVVLRKND